MLSIRDIDRFDAAIAEAERCRVDARSTIEQNPTKYAHLNGQPSGWCVVTRKGFWSRNYHNGYGQPKLKELIERGHEVLMTVGVVADPESPLQPDTHVAKVQLINPGGLSEYKLFLISVRAKLHAARALSN
jgi:hypothetical protein